MAASETMSAQQSALRSARARGGISAQAPSFPSGRSAAVADRHRRLFHVSRPHDLRQPGADHGHVRALARPDPRLCRHRHARACRLLRHRRLYGRPCRRAPAMERADQRAVRGRDRRRHCRLHHRLVPAALSRPDAADADARDRDHAAGDRQSALGHFRRL